MTNDVQPKRLSYRIIGAAIEVHRNLGPGLLEEVYEAALAVEMNEQGIAFERQKHIPVDYKGHDVGHLRADFIVEERAIIEVKSVKALAPIHEAQLMTYLKVTKLKAGLLINFNEKVLTDGIKRIVM